MSFSVGIVGLPNVGKSTLFKALTKKQVDIASYPFTTIDPNVGTVAVPDKRIEEIAELIKPEKITPTIIEFIDIAGLIKGAHKGEGLGNKFLSHIKNCDLILEVVRNFRGKEIEHIEEKINQERDIETVETELVMKDLETTKHSLEKLERELKAKDKKIIREEELLQRIQQNLSQGRLIVSLSLQEEEKEEIKKFQFVTTKPIVYVLNVDEKPEEIFIKTSSPSLSINLKLEEEVTELSSEEKEELGIKSKKVDQLILACYNTLELITFYTVAGGKEVRARTIKKGENILKAAEIVHSDFAEKFIRAEVINWNLLIKAKSWQKAKELGKIRTIGKDYLVQDGDVIEFKI